MKHIKGYWGNFIVILLVLSMTITPMQYFSINSVAAQRQETIIYTSEKSEVVFKVNSQWDTGFEGQFIIYNKSKAPIENWRIKFNFQHEISSIWDGEIESHLGNKYIIKHPSWSQSIPVGGKAIVGFNGKGDKIIIPPTDCIITEVTAEMPKEDYTITYRTTSDWKDAFNGEISITNNTNESIENWQLEFDFDKNINQLWTAKLVKKHGNHYTIKHDSWNSVILPKQTIKLGFEAQPGPATTKPENYKLTKSKIEEEDNKEEEIDYETDTDGDGLEDYYERIEGTDINNQDTDGDGLSDFYEFFSRTSPLLADTNGNGIKDGDEDNDMDRLTNLEEFKLNTDSATDDTDGDGLGDSREVQTYHSDPLKVDTDGDGLSDGDEVLLNTNPLLADTDGNGILDSEEKIFQTLEYKIREEGITELEKAEISTAIVGYMPKRAGIHNVYNGDIFASEVVGRVGVPIRFDIREKFNTATISFTYNSSMESSLIEQLRILYYNEEENIYQIQNSTIDKEKRTISTEIIPSKLGVYIVVNKKEWEEAWKHELKYQNSSLAVSKMDVAFVLDNSESMAEKRLSKIKKGLTQYIDTLGSNDRGALISFTAFKATMKVELCKDKKQLNKKVNELVIEKAPEKAVKPADTINTGLKIAVNHLKNQSTKGGKLIVLFVDGDMKYSEEIVTEAKKSGIKIFVINVGKVAEFPNLKKMIHQMEGYFYDANTSEDIFNSLENIGKIIKTGIDTTDTDGDGLFDIYEIEGMQLTNGQVETMDHKKTDTDGDGINDFDEMNGSRVSIINELDVLGKESIYKKALKVGKQQQKTNKKVKRKDTDGDNISDKYDPRPKDFNINDMFIEKLKKLDYLVTQYCKQNSISFSKHDWYIAMFFRSFGKYYNSPNWKVLAGEIDDKFINYVKQKNIQLYRYFSKRKNQTFIADEKGETVDLIHFGGAMSIQLYETYLDDSIKHQSGIFKKLLGMAPEKYLNAMGGWAGDLQQVVWYIVETDTSKTSSGFENLRKEKKGFYDLTYYSIGTDFAPFSASDLYADIDVIMLDYLRKYEGTLVNCFYTYYGQHKLFLNRINNLINYISKVEELDPSVKETPKMREIREENMRNQFVLDFTREKFHTITWPFYSTKAVLIQEKDSIKVKDAFLDYLDHNREHYIQ